MAWGYFLNFEKLSMQIIEDEISKMSDNNLLSADEAIGEDEVNEAVMIENLHHGAIAITFIVNLFETALNTILSKRMEWTAEDILKASHSLKIQMICHGYGVDFATIKGDNRYRIVREAISIRNDITHYKTNAICSGSWVGAGVRLPMGTCKKPIAELFTKSAMQGYYNGVMNFLEFFCDLCGLHICRDCWVIDCDGRVDLYEFICSKDRYDRVTQEDYDV